MRSRTLTRRTLVKTTAGATAAAALATRTIGLGAQDAPADAAATQELRIANLAAPVVLDPHLSYGRATIGPFTNLMWAGLTKVDGNLQTVPDIATHWEANDDLSLYTFHLDPERAFSDGSPITAHDVVWSWTRSLNPELGSLVAGGYLKDVVGARAYWLGETTDLPTGYRALDDFTLEVELIDGRNYFPDIVVHPSTWVVKQSDVEAHTPDTPWPTIAEGFSGPFTIESYQERQSLVLARNPHYSPPPTIERISYTLVDDPQTQFLLYQNDEVDITPLGVADADHVKNDDPTYRDEFVEQPIWWLDNLYPRQALAPFEDEHVRRAFMMAIDKDSLIQVVRRGLVERMDGIYHPELDVFSTDQPEIPFDPEGARAELAASSYGSAEALPPVSFWSTGVEATGAEARQAAALQEMWRENLGVEVEIRIVPTYAEMLESDVQLVIAGEGMHYVDPSNGVGYLRCDQPANISGFCDEAWEAKINEAEATLDNERKIELYREAEQEALERAALLPLWRRANHFLVKPHVRNFETTAMFTFPTLPGEAYIAEQ